MYITYALIACEEGKKLRQNNVIELNGKRYDALTGKLLGKGSAPVIEPLAPALTQPPIRSVDGLMPKHAATTALHPVPVPATKNRRQHASHTVKAHQPQRASTLMRRAVHKPGTTPKPAIKTQTPHEIAAAPVAAITQKHSVAQINPIRVERAHQTPKHRAVHRFNHSAAQNGPSMAVIQPHIPSAAHTTAPIPYRSSPAPKPPRHSRDIFEEAIARAQSHEQPAPKAPKHRKKHGRLAGTLAGIAAFLVLGGFLAYLNMPGIELRVASFQAGFTAQLPSYSPTGYKLANIENKHGIIGLSFRSGESTYQITQQPSNWNSQTLRDDLIATADHEPVESHGRIIYIYGNSASWVNSGVRYDITGNAHLTKADIVDIATSM